MRARGARERRLGWGVEALRPSLFETLREASLLHSAFVRVRGHACVCFLCVCVCVCVCLCVCMRVRMLWKHMCQYGILVSLSVRVDSFSRAPGFERRRANSRGEVDVPGRLSLGWANGNPLVLRTVVSTFYRIPVYFP